MKFYMHLKYPNLHDKGFYTYQFEVPAEQLATYQNTLTLKQFLYNISKFRGDLNPSYMQVLTHENSKALPNLDMLFSNFFEDGSDIFLICDAPKPVLVSEEKKIYYETLKKFSFFESGDWSVKVNIDLPGIQNHDINKIQCRFLENSFELKVHEFKGKNYLFSVPRASNKIDFNKSKIQIKENQITIVIRKATKDDHWLSLHKVKLIGE
ncbi:hypothetical protein ABPG72_018827 [Tetrahymena utriculariae]